jgi:hypothetical protein
MNRETIKHYTWIYIFSNGTALLLLFYISDIVTNLHYVFIYYILDNLIWLYFPLTPIEKSNRPIVYHVVRLPLHAHQKPGIKTPECNEPSPMNIHVLYLTIVILKLPVPHFT